MGVVPLRRRAVSADDMGVLVGLRLAGVLEPESARWQPGCTTYA